MLIVAALGGNALLRRGEPLDADVQRANVKKAAKALAALAKDHDLVVTHGNGPQVGLLALQAEAYRGTSPYPLDVLGAESEGMIGYMIEQELHNELPSRAVAALLTRVEVDPKDPAFGDPDKPIGPLYTEAEARRLAAERGFRVAEDRGGFYRRVVPSPKPRRILELPALSILLRAGVLVVCAGGGGIPVVVTEGGAMRGVEAVIDKDRTAALLAEELKADALLLLTDVPAVWTPASASDPAGRAIKKARPSALRGLPFARGSIGPKVEAACAFAERTGRLAGIGALDAAAEILRGAAGTLIVADDAAHDPLSLYDEGALVRPW